MRIRRSTSEPGRQRFRVERREHVRTALRELIAAEMAHEGAEAHGVDERDGDGTAENAHARSVEQARRNYDAARGRS